MLEVGEERLPRRCPRCHPHFVGGLTAPGVAAAAANVDPAWQAGALAAIRILAASGDPFTASDLRRDPFSLTEPDTPGRWGAVFLVAARNGLIERIGDEPSTVAGRNGSRVSVWRGRHGA